MVTCQESPEKGISNLEKYVTKRRIDAVGYFLLALLYHKYDEKSKAIKAAAQARALAPGSSLMENLHYFLSHPKGFDAWVPESQITIRSGNGPRQPAASDITLDLDTLISRLTRATQKRIKIVDQAEFIALNEKAEGVENLATPTLALIFEKQKKYDEAINIYRKLIVARPLDAEKFQAQIERIEQLA